MSKTPDFDMSTVHRYFSADCFNKTWDLLDKNTRSTMEDEEMVWLSMTSLWHWTQRGDCTSQNLSIGYWLISRVFAVIGQVDNARRYGQLCLESSQGESVLPFYRGYAYEALARAEHLAKNLEKMHEYNNKAHEVAEILPDPEEKQQLLNDLETIN